MTTAFIISLIIAGVLALITIAGALFERFFLDGEATAFTGLAGLAAIGTFAFGWLVLYQGFNTVCTEEKIPVIALSNGAEVNGNGSPLFISISTDDVIRYAVRADDGAVEFKKLQYAEKAKYYEDAEPKDARIEIVKGMCPAPEGRSFVASFFSGGTPDRITVHVPKGSIVRDFTLDTKN